MTTDQLPALAHCQIHGGLRREDASQCERRVDHWREHVECEFVAYLPAPQDRADYVTVSAHPGEDSSPVLSGETALPEEWLRPCVSAFDWSELVGTRVRFHRADATTGLFSVEVVQYDANGMPCWLIGRYEDLVGESGRKLERPRQRINLAHVHTVTEQS